MKITYSLEVTSSWCFWCEPMWAELKRRYEGRAEFQWKIAKMPPSDWPASREQCDWFYRRSGTVVRSPFMLNSGWFEPLKPGTYPTASYVAEAAKNFGFTGDEIRLALAHASVREGQKVGRMDVAVAIAAKAGGKKLEARKLRSAAESDAVATRIDASTQEFFAHQINQRPAFVVEDVARTERLVPARNMLQVFGRSRTALGSAMHAQLPCPWCVRYGVGNSTGSRLAPIANLLHADIAQELAQITQPRKAASQQI